MLCENDVIQNQNTSLLLSLSATYHTDYGGVSFSVSCYWRDKVSTIIWGGYVLIPWDLFMEYHLLIVILLTLLSRILALNQMPFLKIVFLITQHLSMIKGLYLASSHKVSFSDSKTDKTRFDGNLRSSLKSSGKINSLTQQWLELAI